MAVRLDDKMRGSSQEISQAHEKLDQNRCRVSLGMSAHETPNKFTHRPMQRFLP